MTRTCNSKKKVTDEDPWKKEFLVVKPGCDLHIRLIGLPIKVYNLFNQKSKCVMLDSEETAKRLKAKYDQELSYILTRYYCWCLDREDLNIKILNMPESVAFTFGRKQLCCRFKISGYDLGYDWRITTNGKLGQNVRYETICIAETSLSYMDVLQANVYAEKYHGFDLSRTFRFYNFEEAERKLIGKRPKLT